MDEIQPNLLRPTTTVIDPRARYLLEERMIRDDSERILNLWGNEISKEEQIQLDIMNSAQQARRLAEEELVRKIQKKALKQMEAGFVPVYKVDRTNEPFKDIIMRETAINRTDRPRIVINPDPEDIAIAYRPILTYNDLVKYQEDAEQFNVSLNKPTTGSRMKKVLNKIFKKKVAPAPTFQFVAPYQMYKYN